MSCFIRIDVEKFIPCILYIFSHCMLLVVSLTRTPFLSNHCLHVFTLLFCASKRKLFSQSRSFCKWCRTPSCLHFCGFQHVYIHICTSYTQTYILKGIKTRVSKKKKWVEGIDTQKRRETSSRRLVAAMAVRVEGRKKF